MESKGVSLAALGYLQKLILPKTKQNQICVHFTERGVHSSGRHVRLLQHHFLELPHEDYLLFGGKIRRMVVRLVQLYVLYGALRRDDRPRVTPQPLVLQAAQVTETVASTSALARYLSTRSILTSWGASL
jgi:hypothetical protein